jgi:hypothetical protein
MLDRIPLTLKPEAGASTRILGKDLPLEQTIANMSGLVGRTGHQIDASGATSFPMCGRYISAMRIRRCASPTA